jgi:methylmalonyl-CoA mutase cobalamin-binding domain/chain
VLDRIREGYNEAIFDTDRERALQVVQNALTDGLPAEDLVFQVVLPSLEKFLAGVSNSEFSLAQHFIASQIASEVVDDMIPRFKQAPETVGRVVIGTSVGDFHGLGKRIVTGCLKARMMEVLDLGLNVAPEKFVDSAVQAGARVIGISSMMVHTARGENGCLKVRQLLQERGLESRIKVIVGGAPYRFDENLYLQVGADTWAENGLAAAEVIAGLMGEVISG